VRRRHPGRRAQPGSPRAARWPRPPAPPAARPDIPARDDLYAAPRDPLTGFVFDERVAAVFPDMIHRSVPGYGTIVAMTGVLAGRHAQPGSRCYDLGCSLGAAALAMRRSVTAEDCRILAVDNAPAMIARCRERVAAAPEGAPVDLVCADVQDVVIRNASVVVLNFTLQFVPAQQRAGLLGAIAEGLRPGGLLILSEKLAFEDASVGDLFSDLHHWFKRTQGYSDLEIAQKREALEDVLVPETLATHQERLETVGFSRVETWFQCLGFASLIAFR
jgi:tRNA (cmo5U34)-methyltransferase